MILPPLADPRRYVGLYVYEFQTHVSIGYTAREVRILRESQRYRNGTAYEVYGVSDNGGLELRGVLDERLAATEALCFLRHDAAEARGDFEALRAAARGLPVAAPVELILAKAYEFEPPHVTALTFPAASSTTVSTWLGRIGFNGGDLVVGGVDVQNVLAGTARVAIASCALDAVLDYRERSPEEVLAAVSDAVQR